MHQRDNVCDDVSMATQANVSIKGTEARQSPPDQGPGLQSGRSCDFRVPLKKVPGTVFLGLADVEYLVLQQPRVRMRRREKETGMCVLTRYGVSPSCELTRDSQPDARRASAVDASTALFILACSKLWVGNPDITHYGSISVIQLSSRA